MPHVSVIIPTHNRADVVGEAITSVLAQTYLRRSAPPLPPGDLEVVVVDDGSDDGTGEVVARFGPPVRVVSRRCGGPAAARNTGIRESRGELICFLDSDDLYLPTRLERAVAFLDQHPEHDATYSDWMILREDGRLTKRPGRDFPSGRVFQSLVLRQLWHTNTITIRRRCFDRLGLFDESLPRWEDRDFWLRLAWSCQVGYLPGEVAIYRMERCAEPARGKRAVDCQWQVSLTERWLASGLPFTPVERRALRNALFFSHWEHARQLARARRGGECRQALACAAQVAWEDRRCLWAAVALARGRLPLIAQALLWLTRPVRRRDWSLGAGLGGVRVGGLSNAGGREREHRVGRRRRL